MAFIPELAVDMMLLMLETIELAVFSAIAEPAIKPALNVIIALMAMLPSGANPD